MAIEFVALALNLYFRSIFEGSRVIIEAVSLPGRLVVATEISHRNHEITTEIN